MSVKTYREAINEAMRQEMAADENVFLIGEDLSGGFGCENPGSMGGSFGVTTGLYDEFGAERVVETPISESAIMGAAAGAALMGKRPIAELMFGDFIGVCMDQVINQMAKFRYMFGGKSTCPVVIRLAAGGISGSGAGPQHSQSLYQIMTSFPGLKVVVPSNAYEAKGLMISAIRDDDPVLFFEIKALYEESCEVPDELYEIPFGEAAMPREGNDVTVVAFGQMVGRAIEAVDQLAAEGISCDVIDPRTTSPMDNEVILESVESTGRLIVVDESPPRCGLTADVAALAAEHAFYSLKAPIKQVCAPHTPTPFATELEMAHIPSVEKIADAIRDVMS